MRKRAIDTKKQARPHSVERRTSIVNILFFVLLAVIMSVVVMAVVGGISDSASRDFARLHAVEAVGKFNTYLNRELGLVAQVAGSPALENWFADEEDEAKRQAAYQEIISYTEMLYSANLYFGIHASLNEFSIDHGATYAAFQPFDKLNEQVAYDHWYFDAVHSPNDYTLNIDIDKVTNTKRLWINHKVELDDEIIGVFCSGLQFDYVFDEMFSGYAEDGSVRGIVIDSKGEVQMDSDLLGTDAMLDDNHLSIQSMGFNGGLEEALAAYLGRIDGLFTSQDEPVVLKLSSGHYGYASIAPISHTDWSVVTLFNADMLFSVRRLAPLLYAMLGFLALYVVSISAINRRLIFVPFRRLVESLRQAGTTSEHLYAHDQQNEFGEISRTIESMRDRLADSNAELQAAMQAANQANRAKTEFLSNMSHEIRTPLNAIIGMNAIAQNTHEDARRDECLAKIEDASRHLLRLVNDILDMAKIEADKLELAQADFDLERVLRDVCTAVRYRAEERRQDFQVEIAADMPACVRGDSERLSQVLANLLGNAVKFTPEGGRIALSASARTNEDGVATLSFAVRDNGIGMSGAEQERLFRFFEQVDGGTARKYGGVGLGLAISRRIVEKMGGEISVQSAPGEGSTFSFTARMQVVEVQEEDTPQVQAGFAGRKILLAEDVQLNREIVLAVLEPLGLSIDCAENGAEAVALFSENPQAYDLIFIDVQMPTMDGYEATRRIRALGHPHAKEIPIVAMTANVFKDDIEKCLQSGMDDHLGKPLDFNALLALLQRCFSPQGKEG